MIEEYWQDSFIYYVTFTSDHSEIKFTRALIFKTQKSEDEIKDIVLTRFKNVLEVNRIEESEDGLLLKKEFLTS
ncbi:MULTISPECIES: hypothetical protein [Carnobacterium]|uniref:hypothetical protein n=1 Tax=Carnobacterium TaxID=2747 RepID=UPI002FC79619